MVILKCNALDSLVARNDPTLIVFMDAHHDWKDDHGLERSVMNSFARTKGHAVVLLSPIYKIPLELEKLVTPLDVPLPSLDEVQRLFSYFCQQQGLQLVPCCFSSLYKVLWD